MCSPWRNPSTYATMARDLLVKVCCHRGEQKHLLLDKYKSPSIKNVDRKLRGYSIQNAFAVTGPDQAQRQRGTGLLKNGAFKEAFASFLMVERKKEHYGSVIGNKTIYISHGGTCMMMHNNNDHDLVITEPDNLQSRHEEADTPVAFHAKQVSEGSILGRPTYTDVLVILLGLAGRSRGSNIILDYGSGDHRRFIALCHSEQETGWADGSTAWDACIDRLWFHIVLLMKLTCQLSPHVCTRCTVSPRQTSTKQGTRPSCAWAVVMRKIPWLQWRRSTVLLSHHATRRSETTSQGHSLFRWCGRDPIRRIQLARQVPPTTGGKRTTTAWSQTGFPEGLSQKLSQPLVDTMPQPYLTSVMLRLTRRMIRTERMTPEIT